MDVDIEVGQVLGEGQYGKIYKVKNKKTKKEYAMKINKNVLGPGSLKEVDILSSVKHRNVLNAEKVYFDKNTLIMLLPLMDMDLKKWVSQNEKNEEVEKDMAFQMLLGLQYLHTNYIVHLDLKHENILVKYEENQKWIAKIGDFGLAEYEVSEEPLFDCQHVVTIHWRAPELIYCRKPYRGKQVDCWSMILILFFLFTKKLLIEKYTEREIKVELEKLFPDDPYVNHKKNTNNTQSWQTLYKNFLTNDEMSFFEFSLQPNPANRPNVLELLKAPLFSHKRNTEEIKGASIIEYDYIELKSNNMLERAEVIKELNRIRSAVNMAYEAFFLGIDLFDRYATIGKTPLTWKNIHQYAKCCLFLAQMLIEYRLDLDDMFPITEVNQMKLACFDIMESVHFRMFRPFLSIIFPKIPKEKLKICIINHLTPDAILKCAEK